MQERIKRFQADPILDSVRRIVSRTVTKGEQGEDSVHTPTNVEKLLLTPALRVKDNSDPAPEIPEGRRPRVTTRTLSAERVTLEQRIAELERAVTPDGNWEPDGSEEAEQETPKAFPGLNGVRDASEISQDAMNKAFGFQSERVVETPVEVDPTAPEPVLIRDEPEAEPEPEPQNTEADAAKAADGIEIGGGIDDVALREIVAEIVRSELQGELGERITRNVRKLVRREIYRAMMTRDFN